MSVLKVGDEGVIVKGKVERIGGDYIVVKFGEGGNYSRVPFRHEFVRPDPLAGLREKVLEMRANPRTVNKNGWREACDAMLALLAEGK